MGGFTSESGVWLGPLTTTWSMPDSCSVYIVNCPTCQEGFRGQQCVMNGQTGRAQDHTTCWPPTRRGVESRQYPFVGWGFYSPGLACPTGYTTACTAEYGRRPEWNIQFTLNPGETAAGCCPSGFTCTNRNGNTCIAVISTETSTAIPTASCSMTNMDGLATATFPDVVLSTVTSTTATNAPPSVGLETITRKMVLLAPMFQLNYQSSDLETTTTSSSTSSSTTGSSSASSRTGSSDTTGTAATGAGAGAATTDTTLPAAADGNKGLSTGAMAGIGVGAALGGLLLGALAIAAWFAMRKRRRRRDEGYAAAAAAAADHGGPQELYPDAYHKIPPGWDARSPETVRTELPDYNSPHTYIGRTPVEMPVEPDGHYYDARR